MMRCTNLKQIGCLILATALLVGVNGCDRGQSSIGGAPFEVDGVRYFVHWEVGMCCGNVEWSFLTLHLDDHPDRDLGYYPYRYAFFETKKTSGRWITTAWVTTTTEMLYFVRDAKIVFEKEYSELGIDASRLGGSAHEILEYLLPILEPLIRENVQPQEPEMEKQII